MPSLAPQTLRQNELNEFPTRGPFGGIQTDMPPEMVERFGFSLVRNLMFRKGEMQVRPAPVNITAIPDPQEAILDVADFFTSNGTRIQTVITKSRLLKWESAGAGSWTDIPAAVPLTGTDDNLFTHTVVAGKLLFCQGVDKVQLWNGITATFAQASANAVPARYLFELTNRLIALDTVEGAIRQPQRVRWTGAGDPTDWTSFGAGQNDLFNDLGPIMNGLKLYQSGFIFQQRGITQMIPTGLGVRPFDFVSMSAHSKGCICPYSLGAFGENIAAYVGKDNVYLFDGTQSYPIGDSPVTGSRIRVGARKSLMSEIRNTDLNKVRGFISSSINGTEYYAYWLTFPNGNVWVYNFDEANWTFFSLASLSSGISAIGLFNRDTVVRIMDLIGTIADQTWSPATLTGNNPLDSLFVGYQDGEPKIVDFTTPSESAWTFAIDFYMGDYRHYKSVKKLRFSMEIPDAQVKTFTLQMSNERSESRSQTVNVPGGNTTAIFVVPVNMNGTRLTVQCSGGVAPNSVAFFGFTEITPIYDIAGELRS